MKSRVVDQFPIIFLCARAGGTFGQILGLKLADYVPPNHHPNGRLN